MRLISKIAAVVVCAYFGAKGGYDLLLYTSRGQDGMVMLGRAWLIGMPLELIVGLVAGTVWVKCTLLGKPGSPITLLECLAIVGVLLVLFSLGVILRREKPGRRALEGERLAYQVGTGQPHSVRQALSESFTYPDDASALQGAALLGDEAGVKRLLDKGVPADSRDYAGHTPLMWAASGEHVEIMHLLHERGADVNARANEHGEVPVLAYVPYESKTEALGLLLKWRANPNVNDLSKTLLTRACDWMNAKAIALPLAAGADPNAADASTNRPLKAARQPGNSECVRLLLAAGAHP